MNQNYQIRAVQVDLARQMESIPFLKGFIDFIAENHYNTLFLYLEWRIRTKTFDIGKNDGYSAEELTELIDYAELRGINIIPGLATLGHAEQLLRQKKFASYSELREGIAGRFGNTFSPDMCPSLPETRRFLDSYLSDVAEIFTKSEYFHVGGDEVWDMAFCSKCRAKAPDLASEARLYLEHFQFVHQLVTKLGKRMMLWDDMLDCYQNILPEFPRDIIMVTWQYQENVRNYQSHFFNLNFSSRFALYDKLGFEYLVAPADFCWSNVDTSTAYGSNFKPLGGLLTSWEKSTSLLYKYFPTMAAAGQLWSGAEQDGDSAMALALRQLFGIDDECFLHAVAEYADLAQRIPAVSSRSLTTFSFFGPDNVKYNALQTVTSVLMQYPGKLRDTRAEIILNDIIGDCVLKLLEQRSIRAGWRLLHGEPGESLESLRDEVAEAGKKYAEFYVQHRRKCDVKSFNTMIDSWLAALQEVQNSCAEKGLLTVTFALPDGYGAEKIRILVNGEEVGNGVFKHLPDSLYECCFFLPKNTVVRDVRFEAHGFAGQGIAYVCAKTGKGKFVPAGISGVSGRVEHPEFLLEPNVNYAFFGNRDSLKGFENRGIALEVHSVDLLMKKV